MTDQADEPIPAIPYATPVPDPLPGSVRAIAIVGICLAGITLLQRLLGVVSATFMLAAKAPVFTPEYQAYMVGSGVVFALFAGWLLAAAIGCLRRQPWGRTWLIRYAIAYPVALVADAVGIVLIVAPAMAQFMTKTMAATAATQPAPMPINMGAMMSAMMIAQAIIAAAILMIYPGFILGVMRKPAVRAVFAVE